MLVFKHWTSKQYKLNAKRRKKQKRENEKKKKKEKKERIWWLRLTVAQFSFQSLLFNSHGKVDI